MIALAEHCLVFQMEDGKLVPFSIESMALELIGDTARLFEPEFVQHAANAVVKYFKHELGRQTVSVAEFSSALEKVLRGFKLAPVNPVPSAAPGPPGPALAVAEADLARLADEAADGWELVFFPRLRDELRRHIKQGPRLLRFHGLRHCVKLLAGTQRWGVRCRNLEEQIVGYLRECLSVEAGSLEVALVVE